MNEFLIDVWNYIQGNLSTSGRIWSALAPMLIIIGYALLGAVVFLIRNRIKGPYEDPEMSNRGSSVVLGMGLRQYFSFIIQPPWRVLRFLRLPPNALTTLSVLLAMGAAVAVGAGRFALGGWLYIFSGLCDHFDGRLARFLDICSQSGDALDSVLDRVNDGVMLIGLAWFYRESWIMVVVCVLLVSTNLISYVRAKGETYGVKFEDVGLMQRPERIVYLGLGVALSPILEALYVPKDPRPGHYLAVLVITVMAVSTTWTWVSRLMHTMQALSEKPQPKLTGTDKGSLWRFGLSSVAATVSDFTVVVMLVDYTLGLQPWTATFLGCVVGGVINFTINRAWAFGVKGPVAGQASRYTFTSGSSALLNSGGVGLLLLLPALDYRIAWIIARVAVFLFWNYPLNREWVFSPEDAEKAAGAPAKEPPDRDEDHSTEDPQN